MNYLYLKTHNDTGLKYLGKTTQNPFVYKGSGVYWQSHLKKHGENVTTEILGEFETLEEFAEVSLYYSKLWNVKDNKEFANLIDESGDGGDTSKTPKYLKAKELKMFNQSGSSNSFFGKTHTEETKKKMRDAKIDYVPWNVGIPHSEESKEKMRKPHLNARGVPKPKKECPHCKRDIAVNMFNRYHGDNCKWLK